MTTPAEFREFALDCLHWAEDARMWMNTAIVVDQYVTLAGDTPARSGELRAKLN